MASGEQLLATKPGHRRVVIPKISAANPNCSLLIASSRFIVRAANPRLVLSMKAMTWRASKKGNSFIRSFRRVATSIEVGATPGMLPIDTLDSVDASKWSPVAGRKALAVGARWTRALYAVQCRNVGMTYSFDME